MVSLLSMEKLLVERRPVLKKVMVALPSENDLIFRTPRADEIPLCKEMKLTVTYLKKHPKKKLCL